MFRTHRVLSIYQEVKINMVANLPTLAIYVDYQKAYDRVLHAALMYKLDTHRARTSRDSVILGLNFSVMLFASYNV